MRSKTINKYRKIFNEVISKGISLYEYAKTHPEFNYKSTKVLFCSLAPKTDEEKEIKDLYKSITQRRESVDTNERAEVYYERDENGNIQYYVYNIFKKDRPILYGRLTREEMYIIYRLYTYYGDSLTARVVSRNFPNLSLTDFKRILRAFSIYKDSSPFPPHIIEECSEEELRNLQIREKENSFLRKAEEDRIKTNELLLKKYAQENIELKTNIKKYIDFAKLGIKTEFNNYNSVVTNSPSQNSLVITLSDLHIGAYNVPNGYMELPTYDKEEINRRLDKVLSFINSQQYVDLYIINLGDSIDSFNKQTTRGGHELPCILTDKEIHNLFLEVMVRFFSLINNKNIKYYCVGESNHGGFIDYLNNIILSNILEKSGIQCYICEDPAFNLNINEVTLTALHGKDDYTQFKNFPLVINDKTENWFNNYYLNTDFPFKDKKIIIKGDLHQYAYTRAKSFDYMSCPSLYGSSRWIVSNFGKTPWGISYLNIDSNNNISTGIIND